MSTIEWKEETHIATGFNLDPTIGVPLVAIMSKIEGHRRSMRRYAPSPLLSYSIDENNSALYVGGYPWQALVELPAPPGVRMKKYSTSITRGLMGPLLHSSVTIYFGDRGLSVGVERNEHANDGTYGIRSMMFDQTYRKQPQVLDYELDSALYISFKSSQDFKNWINSCRKSRAGRMISSSTTAVAQCEFPSFENKLFLNKVKGVTGVTITGEPVTGLFDYNTLYPFLYGRKALDGGLLTHYDINDISYTVEGVGVTSYSCVYIRIIVGELTLSLICPRSIHSDDDFGEMPGDTNQVTTIQQETVVVDEPVETIDVATVELTQEQQDRLAIWEIAHITYCAKRDHNMSTSPQVWFSHYVMSLISDGRSPDELDSNLIDLL
jgi:hypothetical protein